MGLERHSSASGMFSQNRSDTFCATVRLRVDSFKKRLGQSNNQWLVPGAVCSPVCHADEQWLASNCHLIMPAKLIYLILINFVMLLLVSFV